MNNSNRTANPLISVLRVSRCFGPRAIARLQAGPTTLRCAIGKAGLRTDKREGDHATPRGSFPLLAGYFRADRLPRPRTRINLQVLRADAGWCDDPASANYNRPVRLPFRHGHETLSRADGVYDVLIVLDYNVRPRVRGRGSAIFFHLAKTDDTGTEGCIAIARADMRRLLPRLSRRCRVLIG